MSPQTIQYLYNVFKDTQLVDDLLHDTFPENYNLRAKTNYLQTIDELKYKKSQATFKALQIGNKT